ncbi:MAG: hypothetical protein LBN97_04940 [Oscillospiraceae bacterium]|jgi:Trk-type K+ transport system membrane component|nr:hypothetical protein [Oscillospiraceae bacterium]
MKKTTKAKEIQTSKTIVFYVMLTYFAGVIIGAIVVLRDGAELSTWLTFIGSLVAIAFGGYFVKAGFENVHKIKKSPGSKESDE